MWGNPLQCTGPTHLTQDRASRGWGWSPLVPLVVWSRNLIYLFIAWLVARGRRWPCQLFHLPLPLGAACFSLSSPATQSSLKVCRGRDGKMREGWTSCPLSQPGQGGTMACRVEGPQCAQLPQGGRSWGDGRSAGLSLVSAHTACTHLGLHTTAGLPGVSGPHVSAL